MANITRQIKSSLIKDTDNSFKIYNSLNNMSDLSEFPYYFVFKNNEIVDMNLVNVYSYNIQSLINYVMQEVVTEDSDIIELSLVYGDGVETYELDKDEEIFYMTKKR